jgi:hypothetical protein
LGAVPIAVVALFEAVGDFTLRAAQRAFIAADNRLLPAGVILPRRLGATGLRADRLVGSSRALMALPIRSRSLFRSATILLRSNLGLLSGSRLCLGI